MEKLIAGEDEGMVMGGALVEGAIDDDVASGHGGYLCDFVGDEEDCCVAGEVAEDVVGDLLEVFVEITEGLVEDKDVGARDDCAAEKCTLQLAAGYFADGGVCV